MELDGSEMEVTAPELECESEPVEESNVNNSKNDLSETENLQVSANLPDDIDDEDDIVSTIRNRKRKEFKILDSESEDEESVNERMEIKEGVDKKDEYTEGVDDDPRASDEELKEVNNSRESNDECDDERKKGFSELRYKSLLDSDSDTETEEITEKSNLSDEQNSDSEPRGKSKPSNPGKKRTDVPKRMSAKQAMEQMKAIKSESQRLYRENHLSIPYHQPKQFSLKEFMNRKTICKPNVNDQKRFSLKMSHEELEEFAKQLEEREKEAAVFFKSEESDNKVDDVEKPKVDANSDADILGISDEKEKEKIQNQNVETTDLPMCPITNDMLSQQSEEIIPRTPEVFPENNETENIFEAEICTYESVTIPETEDEFHNESQEKENVDSNKFLRIEQDSTPKFSNTECIYQVLKEQNLVESPVLKGSPEMFIDLESGDVVTPKSKGVDTLFQRLLKHSIKKKPKESASMSIVSTENGKIEISNVIVTLNEEEVKEQKPGAAYTKLQDSLRKVIMKRRREEIQKRVDECKGSDKENKEDFEEDAESIDDEMFFENDEEELLDEENEQPSKEIQVDENEENTEVDAQEEADASNSTDADDEYDSEDSGESDDDMDDELPEETKSVKTRIISVFDDSEDENDNADTLTVDLDGQKDKCLWNNENIGTQQNPEVEEELLSLCSGRFDSTIKSNVISQIPTTQSQAAPDENELLELCSGTFQQDTQVQHTNEIPIESSPQLANCKRFESSDEENEGTTQPKEKSKQKKIRKLGFSDDEYEEDDDKVDENDEHNVEQIVDQPEEDEEFEQDEISETYIDYDSEENEVEVKMTKMDKREKASEFFEKEAELSESEWGSADEDEKDLDRYEIDLADEEQFDRAKLQSELGKIHMRRVLDDDIREVKKLQEMLIEDEETDGVGRQRQFRWKFLNDGLELESGTGENIEDGDVHLDEEDEISWRKMRYEREMMLKKNEEKFNTDNMELKAQLSTSNGKKITIVNINSTSTTTISQSSSPFLITKQMNVSRGSFLIRDNDTLSKLASITKVSGEQEAGSVRGAKPQNFVFAALDTPQTGKSLKRKSNGREQEIDSGQRKKTKLNSKKKIRLIDHLA